MAPDDPVATLARWREAEQAATPGPWEGHSHGPAVKRVLDVCHDEIDQPIARDILTEADTAFIVTARAAFPLLLGAVEAVLKLADGWDAKAKEIGAQIELEDCEGATAGFKMIGHMNHRDHAAKVREAITSALAGKEAGDELAEPAS